MLSISCTSTPVETKEKPVVDPYPGLYITNVRDNCGEPDEFYPTPLVGRLLMTTFYKKCNGIDNVFQVIWPGAKEKNEIDMTLSKLDMQLYTQYVSERDDKNVSSEFVRFDTLVEEKVTIHAAYYVLKFTNKEPENEHSSGKDRE
jgi:hypothetical protein